MLYWQCSFIFLASAISLGYERMAAQLIGAFTGQVDRFEALVLGVFLGAMGLGMLCCSDSRGSIPGLRLLRIELILCLCGFLLPTALYSLHLIFQIYLRIPNLRFLIWGLPSAEVLAFLCMPVPILLGWASGQEFVLVVKLKRNSRRGRNLILASAYLGSLSTALIYPLWLQLYSPVTVGCGFGLANLLLLSGLLWHYRDIPWHLKGLTVIALLGGLSIAAAREEISDIYLRNLYHHRSTFSVAKVVLWEQPRGFLNLLSDTVSLPEVKRVYSRYQRIDVVYENHWDKHFTLYLDGHYQFSTKREKQYHETMVKVPLATRSKTLERALIVGGGDGLLVRTLREYSPEVQITLVELDPAMIALAGQSPLRDINQNALADSGLRVVIADAFQWVRHHQGRYDAVFADFPFPYSLSTARLFSREFFSAVRHLLVKDGFLMMNAPSLGWRDQDTSERLVASLLKAGFGHIARVVEPGEHFIMATISMPLEDGPNFEVRDHEHSGLQALSVLRPSQLLRSDYRL